MTPKPPVEKTRILLVEDHPILRHGLARLIDEEHDLVVCGESEDLAGAIDAADALNPDLAIVDISLKASNGLDLIRELKNKHPKMPMLVLSMYKESLYAERALRAGARGYLMKQEATDTVLIAIRKVLAGELYLSERMALAMVTKLVGGVERSDDPSLEKLTEREFEVFSMIGQGLGPTEMAQRLGLSVKTIETHREHVKSKLGLRSGSELVRCAMQHAMGQEVKLGDRVTIKSVKH